MATAGCAGRRTRRSCCCLAGCGSRGSERLRELSANNSDNPELFTIPQDQMSHVQVLTVQPTTLTRTLRLTGAVAYNSFRTTPVITQVSGPVSRVVVVPGQKVHAGRADAVCGQSRLLAAAHQLSESQRCLRPGAKGLCPRAGFVPASRHRRAESGAGGVGRGAGGR